MIRLLFSFFSVFFLCVQSICMVNELPDVSLEVVHFQAKFQWQPTSGQCYFGERKRTELHFVTLKLLLLKLNFELQMLSVISPNCCPYCCCTYNITHIHVQLNGIDFKNEMNLITCGQLHCVSYTKFKFCTKTAATEGIKFDNILFFFSRIYFIQR